MKEDEAQGRLGMSPELIAWWGKQGDTADMGADPLQGWLGREQQARAVYKRSLWQHLRLYATCDSHHKAVTYTQTVFLSCQSCV